VPSKVYGVAAAGRPAVFLGPKQSEAARLLERTRAGTVLAEPTGRAVADAILAWRADPAAARAAGARAATAAAAGRDAAAEAFDRLLGEVAGGHHATAMEPTHGRRREENRKEERAEEPGA
jgi:hypothetical protein